MAGDSQSYVGSSGKKWSEDKDRKWELVQIKAFKSWLNGHLKQSGRVVEDLNTDLCDGVALCIFLETSTGKRLPRWDKTPKIEIQRIQNLSIAINFIMRDLGVRLVGIGPEDFSQGNLKLILGLLWSLFRRLRIQTIAAEGKSSEDGLLAWIRKMTDGYDGVSITNFKNSFNDGLAFSALVNKFNPELLDYNSLNKEEQEKNLNYAFEQAEKHLGIPQLLDAEDLVNGTPDERSVTLYCSLYFHAFVSNEERRKIEDAKSQITDQMSDIKSRLETAEEAREALLNRNAELEGLTDGYESEIKFLRQRALKDGEALTFVEDRANLGNDLLSEESAKSGTLNETRSRVSREKELWDADTAAGTITITGDSDRDALLAELEERQRALLAELEEARNRIKREVEARRAKEKENNELRKEIERLRKRVLINSKAWSGLDCLRHNLQDHLEDMYKWRELHALEVEGNRFNLEEVLENVTDKSFEEQIEYLDGNLQEENQSLLKLVKLQDSNFKLKERELKAGWLFMKGRKDWKKRYFALRGHKLYYFEGEDSDRYEGLVDLDSGCEVVRQKAIKEEGDDKKKWPLKITVGERKLFVRANSKKERHSWYLFLASVIAQASYLKGVEDAGNRPDTRVCNIFHSERLPSLYVDNKPLHLEDAVAIARTLPAHDETTVLSVKNASLSEESVKTLADVLEKLQIKELDFSGNNIGASGASAIAKGLENNNSLTELRLHHNCIDDDGASDLAQNFSTHTALRVVDLSDNQIGDNGVLSLVTSLSNGECQVQKVQLSNNMVGDAGATHIGDLLKANQNITSVCLDGNQIGDSGAAALAEALQDNETVTEVDLSNNQIGAGGAAALHKMLEINVSIRTLKLGGNTAIEGGSDAASLLNRNGFVFPDLTFKRA
eukprot:TRINITY_DN12740_c0_g1_i1.p1 TRINITY_DN12740_c0_g1~~TRINITY_DN12740_c0_g1_i1.p1  ORF type:complete len:898 (+),score=381.01 TRINITY_DN12740_c0_g1_i1:140-2833(+)